MTYIFKWQPFFYFPMPVSPAYVLKEYLVAFACLG